MAWRRRDIGFLSAIGGLFFILFLSSLREKPLRTPDNENHQPLLQAMTDGGGRAVVEKGCVVCHNPSDRPLPPGHPPKEQCLICHEPPEKR